MPKSKNWYDRLDKNTKELVTLLGVLVFFLILAAILANPVGAGITLIVLALVGFTIYSKSKTGKWWWTTGSQSPHTPPDSSSPSQPFNQTYGEPIMTERETVTREVFARMCRHCGAKVVGTRTNCPNCGALL